MRNRSLASVNGGMSDRVWLGVNTVEIESLSVVPPVAACYTVWIEERNELEDKVLQEKV